MVERASTPEAGAIEGREMLTVQQVAEYLQVHPESVRRWLRDGSLRGVNLGGQGGWRIRRDELERFIDALQDRS